jgi:hypothetical protein
MAAEEIRRPVLEVSWGVCRDLKGPIYLAGWRTRYQPGGLLVAPWYSQGERCFFVVVAQNDWRQECIVLETMVK